MTRTHHNGTHNDKEYVTRFLDEGRYFFLRQTTTPSGIQVSIYQMTDWDWELLKFHSKTVSIKKEADCCFPIT